MRVCCQAPRAHRLLRPLGSHSQFLLVVRESLSDVRYNEFTQFSVQGLLALCWYAFFSEAPKQQKPGPCTGRALSLGPK